MPEKSDTLRLSPRQRFLSITPAPNRASYRQTMLGTMVQDALVHAYAQLALNASREELNGALRFIDIFQNLSEPVPENKPLPAKNLQAQ